MNVHISTFFPFALGWFFTFSRYLEECSSTLATTYSSGTPGQDASIVTVDQVGRVVVVIMIMKMVVETMMKKCKDASIVTFDQVSRVDENDNVSNVIQSTQRLLTRCYHLK